MSETFVGRRWLIPMGCSGYDHADLPPLNAVPAALAGVDALFGGKLGYEVGLGCDPESLTERALLAQLLAFLRGGQLRREDVVVLWFSGHGYARRGGTLRLLLKDSDPTVGIDAAWVCGLLADSPVERALLVADCCFSAGVSHAMLGAIAATLSQAASQVDRPAPLADRGFVITAATGTFEQAAQTCLIAALTDAVLQREVAGRDRPFLDPRLVMKATNDRLAEWGRPRAWQVVGPDGGDIVPVYPNPAFRPRADRGGTRDPLVQAITPTPVEAVAFDA